MRRFVSLFITLWAVLCLLTACSDKGSLTGRYLKTENGHFLITENGEPLSISDRTKSGALFTGLDSGDLIEISHDAIAETFPGQTGVFTCKKLEDSSFASIPDDALAVLEEMGYTFDFHSHTPAEEPLTVENPASGYCGNTITKVILDGESFSFWGSDSVTLTDILINLSYDPAAICRCLPEFTVNTEFGSGYGVNLSQTYARRENGQAALTTEQVETIQAILGRNCT